MNQLEDQHNLSKIKSEILILKTAKNEIDVDKLIQRLENLEHKVKKLEKENQELKLIMKI